VRTDDAQMRLSMLKPFIELAHCCRDVQNLHGHVRRLRRPQPVAGRAVKGLWEKLSTKWEKRNAELDKSNSAAMRALLRWSTSGRGRRLTMRACST
jgi:hypothetical protein